VGGLVIFILICSTIVLVACHALRLPILYWTVPLLAVLSSASFLGIALFRPDDARMALDADSRKRELTSLISQRGRVEAEVSRAQERFDERYLNYQGILKVFQSRINCLRSTDWRALQGIPFENFLVEVFREWGYLVETTKTSGDQGVDLIVSKEDVRIAIQAKGYVSSTVGNSAVQEAHTGMTYYQCQQCAVITNSTFTAHARDLAARVGCILIDRTRIPGLIEGQVPW
jgi:hypothetical protein